jgi:transmembrane sensor
VACVRGEYGGRGAPLVGDPFVRPEPSVSDDPLDPYADIEPPDWTLVARCLAGEGTAADQALLLSWVAGDLRRAGWLEAMRQAWAVAQRPEDRQVDGSALAGSVWARVRDEEARRGARAAHVAHTAVGSAQSTHALRPVGRRERSAALWRVGRIAAGIVMAVGALALWRTGWFAAGQPFREFTSARGSRTTITLRDGTRLLLGPASSVRVPADFGVSSRAVELDGEALLTVVHDPRHPFTVRTARAVVRDVGTTFVVHAYAGDITERVAVAEGEVAIGTVSLKARDGASIDSGGQVTVRRGIDLARELAWVQGGLAFKDTPLRDAVRELGRLYDVDVTIADSSLASKPITGSFRTEAIDEVLSEVAFAVGAHYERVGRSVVIRRGVGPAGRTGSSVESGVRIARARGAR